MSIQQRKLQNNNAKIDVTGKVHPRQSSPRPSAVGDRHVRFLLSTLLLGTPWTMNGEITQNPSSGEARHATRQGSRHSISVSFFFIVHNVEVHQSR